MTGYGMTIYTFAHTGRVFGGSTAREVGSHLEVLNPNFGPAIEELNVTIAYLGGKMVRGQREPFTAKASRRFERKRKILRATWIGRHLDADTILGLNIIEMTVPQFQAGFKDVVEGFEYALQSVKPDDDFDVSGFMAWVRQVQASNWGSDDDLRDMLRQDQLEIQRRYQEADPWSLLDIDWEQYPAKARKILDDPSDWSTSEDFSPHGNDTGFEIFHDWKALSTVDIKVLAREFIAVDPSNLTDMRDWTRWVQLHLALAFGHIKKTARCPENLRVTTLAVLMEDQQRTVGYEKWEHKEAWLKRIARYTAILNKL